MAGMPGDARRHQVPQTLGASERDAHTNRERCWSRRARLAVVTLGVWVALAAAGCGGAAQTTTQHATAPGKPATVKPTTISAPTYRAGQYCHTKHQARYRSFGFVCADRHLRAA
jgi:hypothetical protein